MAAAAAVLAAKLPCVLAKPPRLSWAPPAVLMAGRSGVIKSAVLPTGPAQLPRSAAAARAQQLQPSKRLGNAGTHADGRPAEHMSACRVRQRRPQQGSPTTGVHCLQPQLPVAMQEEASYCRHLPQSQTGTWLQPQGNMVGGTCRLAAVAQSLT